MGGNTGRVLTRNAIIAAGVGGDVGVAPTADRARIASPSARRTIRWDRRDTACRAPTRAYFW